MFFKLEIIVRNLDLIMGLILRGKSLKRNLKQSSKKVTRKVKIYNKKSKCDKKGHRLKTKNIKISYKVFQ